MKKLICTSLIIVVALLNVSNYAKGIYVYEVNGVSNKFIVQ
jgi:hypothetical protein